MFSVSLCAQLACIWEVTARKPGNVHRYQDFANLSYADFIVSAAAVAPVLEGASARPVGETILEGVRATRQLVATNTNLGILLLLAPMAAVAPADDLRTGLQRRLDALDERDARAVYQAIRMASPGGLGTVPEQDVHQEPSQSLGAVMQLAAERDLIARQYVNGFREVLDEGEPALRRGLERARTLEGAIIYCHLHLMASYPDSLIARKRGCDEAAEAAQRAWLVLEKDWPTNPSGWRSLTDLDAWLRADGNARNPGTSADLVTASLFVALREGTIEIASRLPWSCRVPS
jgi:triphosphoribosyl-dephospho-CoA synthase